MPTPDSSCETAAAAVFYTRRRTSIFKQAPIEAAASIGEGGATKRYAAFAVLTVTAEAQPARLATTKLVPITMRVHPFPFRTRKLSSSVATILGWRRPGKIARRQHKDGSCENAAAVFLCPVASQVRKQGSHRSVRFDGRKTRNRVSGSETSVLQTEASASVWRGGATEHLREIAAFTVTAITKPVRSATTPARRQHKESSCGRGTLRKEVVPFRLCISRND